MLNGTRAQIRACCEGSLAFFATKRHRSTSLYIYIRNGVSMFVHTAASSTPTRPRHRSLLGSLSLISAQKVAVVGAILTAERPDGRQAGKEGAESRGKNSLQASGLR